MLFVLLLIKFNMSLSFSDLAVFWLFCVPQSLLILLLKQRKTVKNDNKYFWAYGKKEAFEVLNHKRTQLLFRICMNSVWAVFC